LRPNFVDNFLNKLANYEYAQSQLTTGVVHSRPNGADETPAVTPGGVRKRRRPAAKKLVALPRAKRIGSVFERSTETRVVR